MNSVSEASQAGIPLITIPLFGDQHRNAKMAEFRGFGIVLNSLELTSDSISNAIQQIVENRRYFFMMENKS
jgi:UDP:flavonoid glycosyltransferase YjiC (YdhE family)